MPESVGRPSPIFKYFVLLLVALSGSFAANGQSHFEPNPDGTYVFKNQSGTSINQDYYQYDPNANGLLRDVETNHMSERQWKHFAEGDYSRLSKDLKYTLEKFPNHPTALTLLGSLAKVTENPTMPLRYYEHALTLYPQHAFTHALYGKYLVSISVADAGIKKLERALDMNDDLGLVHAWMAEALAKNGQPELARQAAQKARDRGYKRRIPGLPSKDSN